MEVLSFLQGTDSREGKSKKIEDKSIIFCRTLFSHENVNSCTFEKQGRKQETKNEDDLPGYIKVYRITDIITKKDMLGLGHYYLLNNGILHDAIPAGIK